MSRVSAARFALFLVLSASAFSACRADESVLDAIFECDPNVSDAQCGTDENGKPMTCYIGSAQLGGKAFCTKSCDPTLTAEPGFLCTASGALLERCQPSAEEPTCQSPLNCYRTDAIVEDGVCLLVPVCPYVPGSTTEVDDAQCTFTHQVCAGALLRSLTSMPISTNNFHCVARRCPDFDCPQVPFTEVCPTEFYSPLSTLPSICAEQCDRFTCPPNFTCIGRSSPGAPPVCLPGIIGMRCARNEDCLAGDCIDTGAGFSVCTLSAECRTDAECDMLGTTPPFLCLEGIPGEGGHCLSTIPFNGVNCDDSSQCAGELRCGSDACPPRQCSHYSHFFVNPQHGECRFECDPAEGCPAFGGLPHVCLGGGGVEGKGGCYPGVFGVPCTDPRECVPDLSCEAVPPDERSRSTDPKICTVACNDDRDCSVSANPWLGPGYCVPVSNPDSEAVGFCRLAGESGKPCDKPEHCLTGCCPPKEAVPSVCEPEERCGLETP